MRFRPHAPAPSRHWRRLMPLRHVRSTENGGHAAGRIPADMVWLGDGAAARQCDRLLSLLTLQHAHGADTPEWGVFVVLDPRGPVGEEICVHADGLREAIERAYALDQESASVVPRAA